MPGAKSTSPGLVRGGLPQTPGTGVLGPRPTREPACACPQRLLLLAGARAPGGREGGRLPGTRCLAPAHSDHVSSVLGVCLSCSCWCSASASWWLVSSTCTSPGSRYVHACVLCLCLLVQVCVHVSCSCTHLDGRARGLGLPSGRGGVRPGSRPIAAGKRRPSCVSSLRPAVCRARGQVLPKGRPIDSDRWRPIDRARGARFSWNRSPCGQGRPGSREWTRSRGCVLPADFISKRPRPLLHPGSSLPADPGLVIRVARN